MNLRICVGILSVLCATLAGKPEPFRCASTGPSALPHYEFGLLYSEGYGGIDDDVQKSCKTQWMQVRDRFAAACAIWVELERGTLDMAGSGVQNPARDKFRMVCPLRGGRQPRHHRAASSHHHQVHGRLHCRPQTDRWRRAVLQLQPQLRPPGADLDRRQTLLQRPITPSCSTACLMPDAMTSYASQFLSLHYFKILRLKPPKRIEDWDPDPPTPSGLVVSKKSFTAAQGEGWQRLIRAPPDRKVRKDTHQRPGEEMGPRAMYGRP